MRVVLLIILGFSSLQAFSQIDSGFIKALKALDTADILKSDTLAPPNDVFTQKIKILRKERKGLTTENILRIKIMEEQQKDTVHSKEFYKELQREITTGKTGQLLENSFINLYRNHFTEKEVDDLISFYKSSAGKKMDNEFILLMVQSVKGGEQLMKIAGKNVEKRFPRK
jgi:hypothetical protein